MERAAKAEVPILQIHHNVIEPRPSSLRDEEHNWYTWITKVGQLVIKQTRVSGYGKKWVLSEAVRTDNV